MVPIEKNILVVDEFGNEYEATWPKRAKGLVKNGRARFVSENKICLACPPEIDLEDNEMIDIDKNGIAMTEDQSAEKAEPVDLAYIFRQIKEIQDQTTHLNLVVNALSQMSDGESGDSYSPGNIQGKAKADALGDIVRCRETTNQKLLDFYISVYNDMTSESEVTKFLQYHVQ